MYSISISINKIYIEGALHLLTILNTFSFSVWCSKWRAPSHLTFPLERPTSYCISGSSICRNGQPTKLEIGKNHPIDNIILFLLCWMWVVVVLRLGWGASIVSFSFFFFVCRYMALSFLWWWDAHCIRGSILFYCCCRTCSLSMHFCLRVGGLPKVQL